MDGNRKISNSATFNRREFLQMAGAFSMVGPAAAADVTERKPNVIVILSDDHGYADLSCHGCKDVSTPNIDSIAANGARFTDAYVSSPVCSPSRAGLITGRYQERFGHDHNPSRETEMSIRWGLPLNQKTIADYMKDLGYATAAIGKWHLGDDPQFHPNRRGFDYFFGFIGGAHSYLNPTLKSFNTIQRNGKPFNETAYLTDAFAREAVSFIGRHKQNPFFLYLPFNAVHAPLDTPPKHAEAFLDIKDSKRRALARVLTAMDDGIGLVLDAIRQHGLEENTLIIFLSDNGGPTPGNASRNDPFKGHKTQVHEGGIRVPFVAQWTGRIPAGRALSQPVISLDLLPTIVQAAGGMPESNIEGVSLLPLLTGSSTRDAHEALFWRFDKQSAIRAGDWKMSRHAEIGVRLHNLLDDPGERRNLAPANPGKLGELQARWDEWNRRNVKPLWPCKQDAPWTHDTW